MLQPSLFISPNASRISEQQADILGSTSENNLALSLQKTRSTGHFKNAGSSPLGLLLQSRLTTTICMQEVTQKNSANSKHSSFKLGSRLAHCPTRNPTRFHNHNPFSLECEVLMTTYALLKYGSKAQSI